jgi:hypothetical protein
MCQGRPEKTRKKHILMIIIYSLRYRVRITWDDRDIPWNSEVTSEDVPAEFWTSRFPIQISHVNAVLTVLYIILLPTWDFQSLADPCAVVSPSDSVSRMHTSSWEWTDAISPCCYHRASWFTADWQVVLIYRPAALAYWMAVRITATVNSSRQLKGPVLHNYSLRLLYFVAKVHVLHLGRWKNHLYLLK